MKRVFTSELVFGSVKLEGGRRPVVARLTGDTVVVEGSALPHSGEVDVLLPNLGWVRASVGGETRELPLAA